MDNLDLITEDGEFVVLAGPSGCGKTMVITAMQMNAPLEGFCSGTTGIKGENIIEQGPSARDVAIVFHRTNTIHVFDVTSGRSVLAHAR